METLKMRNRVTNPKTLRRLSRRAGFEVITALTRGSTNHRFDVVRADDGCCWRLFSDNAVERSDLGMVIANERYPPAADPVKGR